MAAIDDQATQSLLDGRYRLEACVGRGATSMVYRAEDLLLGRTVAIKLLRQSDETPISLERVRTEVALLANLKHPSLVTLYDARLDPGQPHYLAMEYVEGPTLASRLVSGPLSGAEAASVAHDLAAGLDAVHRAGIIHRDVKPSNVLMPEATRPADHASAKLTDFGIAFDVDDPRRTSPGIAIGTAAYMAPEQVRAADLTTAVDVYSLGLVLIEALTGEPAFPVAGGVQTALRRLTERPAIPESLDAGWRTLLARMTRDDPAERPSAAEVAAEAEAIRRTETSGGGVGTAPPIPTRASLRDVKTNSDDDAPTGQTRAYTAAAVVPPPRFRRTRIAVAAALGAAALSLIAFLGFHGIAPSVESPARIAVHAPQTSPPASPAADPATQQPSTSSSGASSGQGTTTSQPNSNKGPGNNSGKGQGSSGHGKGH